MSKINRAPIVNPSISINPSKKLKAYISNIKVVDDLPIGIGNIVFKNKPTPTKRPPPKIYHLITEEDEEYIKSVNLGVRKNILEDSPLTKASISIDKLLSLEDLHWLYGYLQKQNKRNDNKVYLHELLEDSEIILPKNEEIPRNEELEKRCHRLKAEQDNLEYFKMTKNVDSKRNIYPEDTIGYQCVNSQIECIEDDTVVSGGAIERITCQKLKQMNRHMVAIFQFIMSVAAGFAFGFIGLELLTGNLDFGFRLLLGIICALTVALAELYFLAKKLNEDLQFESNAEKTYKKGIKLD